MSALSERDMRVLAFERGTWRSSGVKEQGISEALGMSATRYYQLLNALIDTPEALQFDPSLVKRLRAQRSRRAALRSFKLETCHCHSRVPGHKKGRPDLTLCSLIPRVP